MRRCLVKAILLFLCISISYAATAQSCGVTASFTPFGDTTVAYNSIINFTSTSTNATSYQFFINNNPYAVNSPVTALFGSGLYHVKLIAKNGSCVDSAESWIFGPGNAPSSRSNIMTENGVPYVNQAPTTLLRLKEGGYLLGAVNNLNLVTPRPDLSYLLKVSDSGCIIWSKLIASTSTGYSTTYSIVQAADSGFYVAGQVLNGGQIPFLSKIDKDGNVVWTKEYKDGAIRYNIYSIYVTDDGDLLLSGINNNTELMAMRTDAQGNAKWSRRFLIPNLAASTKMNSFLKIDNTVYIGGSLVTTDLQYKGANVIRLDYNTGSFLNASSFQGAGILSMHWNGTDILVNGNAAGVNELATIWRMATDGFPLGIPITINATTATQGYINTQLHPLPSGDFLFHYAGTTPSPIGFSVPYNVFIKFDPSFIIKWKRLRLGVNSGKYVFSAVGPHESLTTLGYQETSRGLQPGVTDSWRIYTKKFDSTGDPNFTACNFSDVNVTVTPATVSMLLASTMPNAPGAYTAQPSNAVILSDAFYEVTNSCPPFIDSCAWIRVSGRKTLCNLNDQYFYRFHKNKECTLPVQWKLPAGVQLISQSDSGIIVKFNAFGTYSLHAILSNGCSPIRDSIKVVATSRSGTLNLGRDTSICPNSTITLHAGPGFLSYSWQNGSTDSVLVANGPGMYWVQVLDSCGNMLRDTLNILPVTNLTVDAGPDREKCNADSLILSAPPGYITYAWTPNYNNLSPNTANTTVFPSVDTSYVLKAQKSTGCFAYDTIYVKVNRSPAIDLGKDTSFCQGKTVTIDAGNGFSNYLWSTGATSSSINVSAAGQYSVIGTTAKGCRSYDTMRVISVHALPVVNLNDDPRLCFGDTRALNAGPGFTNYAWNDGSNNATLVINNIGTYHVTVTDNKGCKGSDTVDITTILPLPAGFLPGDTSICVYGKLELKPVGNFMNYLWNTQATSPAITIAQPGKYWLQVKDNNNCIGTDSIYVVRKECMVGFYVPNAFSPNNDRRNEIFRPLLFGDVVKYEFKIYNRWGQMVFHSNDRSRAWDGRLAGRNADAGAYVWVCTYQFRDEPVHNEKGTVLLLR